VSLAISGIATNSMTQSRENVQAAKYLPALLADTGQDSGRRLQDNVCLFLGDVLSVEMVKLVSSGRS